MSINKSRRPPRGNTQRRSVPGLSPYTETRRPGATEPLPPETTTPPPPVIMNGSALTKASAVVVGTPSANDAANDAAIDAGGGDDSPPDSSTRSKEGSPEPKAILAKSAALDSPPARTEESKEPSSVGHAADESEEVLPAKSKAASPKIEPKVDTHEERKSKTGRPDRAERRSRERGKGGRVRSSATPTPPPAEARALPEVEPANPATSDVPGHEPSHVSGPEHDPRPVEGAAPHHVDLDERFFAEGVQSEHELLAAKAQGVAHAHEHEEEEIDPKILLKMHPDVRARRAKYAPVVKWVILAAVVVGLLGLWKHRSTQGDQEQAAREMEEYKLTHPPGSRTNNPAPVDPSAQAAAQPPAAAAAPASAAPAQSAPAAEPAAADNAQPNAVKTAASAESKPGDTPVVAAAATASASASAGASAAPPEAPLAPAKTAAQEKRDCQVFLDRGAFPRAIEAGQRSVALDPSDGEAWLLLGAAYQATGRKGDAKRSFSACISQGKRGPIGDCKSMLQ